MSTVSHQHGETPTDKMADDHEKQEQDSNHDTAEYPPKKVMIPIVLSICLASFLASLVRTSRTKNRHVFTYSLVRQDRTIIGVAVPAISNEFRSFSDISWYESAYLLTFSALQLPTGKIYVWRVPLLVCSSIS